MFQGKRKVIDAALIPTWADLGLSLFPDGSPESPEFPADPVINTKVALFKDGEITSLKVDAIVCPANAELMPGGAICGIIHMVAGPELADECRAIGRVATGSAVVTNAHNLNAAKVIHGVGPIGFDREALESTYKSILGQLGEDIRSVAVPLISVGVGGFPLEDAVDISLLQFRRFLDTAGDIVERIVIVPDGAEQTEAYERLMPKYFPVALPAVTESLVPDDTSYTEEEEEEEEEDGLEPSILTF